MEDLQRLVNKIDGMRTAMQIDPDGMDVDKMFYDIQQSIFKIMDKYHKNL